MQRKSKLTFGVLALAAVAAILVVTSVTRGASTTSAEPASTPDAQQGDQGTGIDLARHEAGDPLALGRDNAPVVLVEYADFRCPFCGIFARDTKPELMKYVQDGTVRIEWHDLPVFGQESVDAAVAGRAAAKQGRFWQFYDATFAEAPARGHLALPRAKLVELAGKAGVPNLSQYAADLDDPALLAQVHADAQRAQQIGANSTPLFFVNDEPILGAQPVSVFVTAIEHAQK